MSFGNASNAGNVQGLFGRFFIFFYSLSVNRGIKSLNMAKRLFWYGVGLFWHGAGLFWHSLGLFWRVLILGLQFDSTLRYQVPQYGQAALLTLCRSLLKCCWSLLTCSHSLLVSFDVFSFSVYSFAVNGGIKSLNMAKRHLAPLPGCVCVSHSLSRSLIRNARLSLSFISSFLQSL